jgi:hypothetical protein
MPVKAESRGTPLDIADGWSLAAADDVGLDGARLGELDRFLKLWPKRNIHAVVVVREGAGPSRPASRTSFGPKSATSGRSQRA